MANALTDHGSFPIAYKGMGGGIIKQYTVSLDTAADLTVHTPASDAYAAVIGVFGQDGAAFDVTFKTASTVLCTLESSALSGPARLQQGLLEGPLCSTKKGEALNMTVTAGASLVAVVWVLEYKQLSLG